MKKIILFEFIRTRFLNYIMLFQSYIGKTNNCKQSPVQKVEYLSLFLLFLIATLYIFKLDSIPLGLFCDEAIVGHTAYSLLHLDYTNFIGPFFYKHFGYTVPSLNVLTTAPFVLIFGLSEFSVRIASVFMAFSSFFTIYKTIKLIDGKLPATVVLIYACTPFFFHISRTNFGHLFSHFFFCLFIYFWIHWGKAKTIKYSIWAGCSLGLAMYGYLGSMVYGALWFTFVILLHSFSLNSISKLYKNNRFFFYSYLFITLPIIIGFIFIPELSSRIKHKNADAPPFISSQKLIQVAKLYPVYFQKHFLVDGKNEDPIFRHRIKDQGIILKTQYFLLALALAGFLLTFRTAVSRPEMAILAFALFYPAGDVIFASENKQPYTLGIFPGLICLPFFFNLTIDILFQTVKKTSLVTAIIMGLLITVTVEVYQNMDHYFTKYIGYSSDFFGWQYGAKPIMTYLLKEKDNYDDMFIAGDFNEPDIFIKFYDPTNSCHSKCQIGFTERYDKSRKQLFIFRSALFSEIPSNLKRNLLILDTIQNPNGETKFYITTFLKN